MAREVDFTDDSALRELRQQFEEDTNAWADIRSEAQTDMRYVAGDPWEDADKRARKDAGRPCISLDQINQFCNQTINNIRQNKRDGQLIPEGFGANDEDARLREDAIRGIEYRSKAQTAHICALQNAVHRSYGFERILTKPELASEKNELGIYIKRVPNPDVITIDPNFTEADGSDMKRAWVLDLWTKTKFREEFPKAKIQAFGPDIMRIAPNWIRKSHVQVCEAWKIKKGKVIQQIINGVEIVRETTWPASRIPIPCCFGMELWLDSGAGPERKLLSLVRLARDPQMLAAFLQSQMCEEAGLTPKTPFVGYKGQFESDSEAWEYATKIARAYLQVDPIVDQATGQILPLPTRPQFTPNFAAYVAANDMAGRAIQAAMGIMPLPTAAQRMNQKSGVAIERIQSQESIGSYHFVDNYDGLIENAWRQMNELLDPIYDTARHVPAVKKDGTKTLLRVNDPTWAAQHPDDDHLALGDQAGTYGATIIIGPNMQSERESVSDFVDTLLEKLPTLGLPAPINAKVLSIAIKMKNLGAKGDELAEIISPKDQNNISPAAQAQIAQLQAKIAELGGQLSQLLLERQGKNLELQTKERIEHGKNLVEMSEGDKDREAKIAVAEISTKAQRDSEREALVADLMKQFHIAAHDIAKQAADQAHQRAMAQFNAAQQPPPGVVEPQAAPTQ
jgi:hypothetical protein